MKNGDLPLYILNFEVITLLPKKEDASRIEQYRPICLLNVSFKIFTKVGTNRATVIAHKVIRPTKSYTRLFMNFIGRKWMNSFLKLTSKKLMIKSNGIFFSKLYE
jgi:hypothetical protein